jgi:hypothetical protein
MHQRVETEKSYKICYQQRELFLMSRTFATIMEHAPSDRTYSCEFVLVQLYSVSSNNIGVKLLFYQCVSVLYICFIYLSKVGNFVTTFTKTAFRSYHSSRSSKNTKFISFLLRFSLSNRPHKFLGDRKSQIRFWGTGKDT